MTGVYVAVNYSVETLKEIKNIMDIHNIPNPLEVDKIHTTLIYSKVYDDVDILQNCRYPSFATGYEIWKTQGGKNALVLKLHSPSLVERHQYLMGKYNLTYDYDEYKPHITLSYDVPEDYDYTKLSLPLFIMANREYMEDLVDDWSSK
jgi:hypothetical protein